MRRRSRVIVALTVTTAFALSGCAASAATSGSSAAGASSVIQVVAAENFWGSIATQLGGTHAQVTSIIVNPDADPHDYEPTASDARIIASADMVLINGVGYAPGGHVGSREGLPRGRLHRVAVQRPNCPHRDLHERHRATLGDAEDSEDSEDSVISR